MKFIREKLIPILIILVAAAGLKAMLLWLDVIPFNADEAVIGLMARHILAGSRPTFFYGQAYMGSLDAWLIAAGFLVFGQNVWVIRLVQVLLYLGIIITTVILGYVGFHSFKTGIWAGIFLIVPTVNVTLYTTASLGGYGEALLLGNIILIISFLLAEYIKSYNEEKKTSLLEKWWLWFLWGLFSGFGVWVNGLTLVYSLPAGIALLWLLFTNRYFPGILRTALKVSVIAIGLLIGAAPWWIYALQHGWHNLIVELLGNAVAVDSRPWLIQSAEHLVSFVLFGITVITGIRPPWEIRWLALPLLPFVLIFWAGVLWFWGRQLSRQNPRGLGYSLLFGVTLVLVGAFILTPFGVDPSGRYFVPLAVPLSLIAAEMIQSINRSMRWRIALIGFILIYNGWATWQCAAKFPPGLTTQFDAKTQIDQRYIQDAIHFLKENGEFRGYTNYWVAYPLAFLSDEQLIYVPLLPYHQDMRYTPRDNRYLPYMDEVNSSQKTAYITTNNPMLDDYLTGKFQELDVGWSEKVIGDFKIYYRLSAVVRPSDIGLGVEKR